MTVKHFLNGGLLLAGFVFLMASIPSKEGVSAEFPIPEMKPRVEATKKSAEEKSSAPRPNQKPQNIKSNNKKITIAEEGGVKIVEFLTSLPTSLLPKQDAKLIEEIFTLQSQGKMKQADSKIPHVKSDILKGHILAERYLHPTAYQTTTQELSTWLNQYSDHPQANRIYKLALKKASRSARKKIKKPKNKKQIAGNIATISQQAKTYKSTKRRDASQQARVNKLYREIKSNVHKGKPTLAYNILNNDYALQFIDDVEYDELQAIIASGYLYSLNLDQARRLASKSFDRSADQVPLSGWVKGMVDWQRGKYRDSAFAFERSSSSVYASGWLVSAAAYWASRAHLKMGNDAESEKNLSIAATQPRTFYGLIAVRSLGNKSHFNWKIPKMTDEDVQRIESKSKGKRAAALIAANQKALAEAELRTVSVSNNPDLAKSLLSYADHYNLSSVLMLVGNVLPTPRGNFYDAALYPMMDMISDKKAIVDEALLNAFIRQESRFNQLAYNASGATGLMQLMPNTANHVSGKNIYKTSLGQYELNKPSVNLDLGQKYIQELLGHSAVNNDVMALAVAYNAGPGNLSKWKRERSHIKDPLLFIETIPFNETRAFVERVVSNYWIYKMRMGKSTPSLDAVAKEKWTKYASN